MEIMECQNEKLNWNGIFHSTPRSNIVESSRARDSFIFFLELLCAFVNVFASRSAHNPICWSVFVFNDAAPQVPNAISSQSFFSSFDCILRFKNKNIDTNASYAYIPSNLFMGRFNHSNSWGWHSACHFQRKGFLFCYSTGKCFMVNSQIMHEMRW